MHRIDGPGATVGHQFTEGDPVGGIQATVVTAPWLNDVQEEVISVLADQSITPVKGTQNQLLTAIKAIAGKLATEVVAGVAKIATQVQVDAGADDSTVVTPKKLRWGFVASFTANGYITFPSWLGGLIIQWGFATTTSGVVVPNFPLAFPSSCLWAGMCIASAAFLGQLTPSVGNTTLTTIQLLVSTGASVGAGSVGVRWLAIGR
jgi:hypothetical protein